MKDRRIAMSTFHRVSDWFDQDSHKVFKQVVRSGDILELRQTKCSHWGIAYRIKQPPSPARNKNKPPKPMPDEIMVYHLIHSSTNRGQVGLFTLEEFWQSHCRLRINNTPYGSSLYAGSKIMPKADILQNAVTAHISTQLKWQTCSEFIRWSSGTSDASEDKKGSNSSISPISSELSISQ